jgi:rubrerythrin
VPKAIAEFATHAKAQHTDHANAFNAALRKAGAQPYTKPDPVLAGPVTEMYGKITDLAGLAKLALTLENTAAATYTKQMGELTSAEAVAAVATIAPVERQHAAILLYVLGEYPVPDAFVQLGETDTSLGARPNDEAA